MPERVSLEFAIFPYLDFVHWFLDLNPALVSRHAADCDNWKASFPLADNEEVCKSIDVGAFFAMGGFGIFSLRGCMAEVDDQDVSGGFLRSHERTEPRWHGPYRQSSMLAIAI